VAEYYQERYKMIIEQWKPIEGFNYKISNLGRIINNKFNKEVKPYMDKGRLKITFMNNEKKYSQNLAQLVYKYFISDRENKPHIIFKDGNIKNCAVDNLIRQISNRSKPQPKPVKQESKMDLVTFSSEAKIPYCDNVTVRPKSYSNYLLTQFAYRS
jgi:hypothetical protein